MPNFNEEVRKTNDPRKAATAYLDWCKSKGYTPKFDKFASHPNYYKLLEDFTTLVDETYMPQEAVKFVFPTEESAFGSLETLIEQGLEEDAILEGQRDAKVGAIVDELQEARYSLIVVNGLKNALKEFDANGDIVVFAEAVSKVNKEYGYHNYLTNVVMDYEEDGDADWFVSRIRNVVGEANEDYAPYTVGGVRYFLSEEQASSIIEAMKTNAEVAPQLELTPENWVAEFGENGVVSTPIGEVKMSDNQYQKMQQQGRNTKFGMVKPTLTNPNVIIEEESKPKNGREAERNSSFVFVKAFTNAEGTGDYMFTSVSNLRDGIEIVMSNQEKETPRVKRLLKEGKLAYINKATLPSEFTASAQGDQSTLPSEVSYSKSKDTTSLAKKQANEQKFSLISPEMDAAYLSAVERGDMATAQQMVMEAAKLAMPNTKVVDKNGNPKVVYHQTNHSVYINRETGQNWDELDWRERMEWDERDDWDEYWEEREFNTFSRVNARTTNELDGFFFAPEYDEYHEYGDRTIEAFLNIKNPASNAKCPQKFRQKTLGALH